MKSSPFHSQSDSSLRFAIMSMLLRRWSRLAVFRAWTSGFIFLSSLSAPFVLSADVEHPCHMAVPFRWLRIIFRRWDFSGFFFYACASPTAATCQDFVYIQLLFLTCFAFTVLLCLSFHSVSHRCGTHCDVCIQNKRSLIFSHFLFSPAAS